MSKPCIVRLLAVVPVLSVSLSLSAAGRKDRTFRAGEHFLERTEVFTAADSGSVWRAEPGAAVTISGGRRVTGWRKEADGLWSAEVPWATDRTHSFHHIVVNGERREIARTPDEGYFTAPTRRAPEYAGVDWMSWEYSHHKTRVAVATGDVHPDWDLSNGDVIFYHLWNDSHTVPTKLEIDRNGDPWLHFSVGPRHNPCNALWRLENIREIADRPGEWAVVYAERRLYYRPKPGEDMAMAAVIVPCLDEIVRIEGAKGVRFEGIRFADSRAGLAAGDRNDQQAAYSVGAAIVLSNATDCAFERCAFERTDGYAIEMREGTCGTKVLGCRFRDLGAGGVHLSGGGCGWAFEALKGETFHTDDLPDPRTLVRDNEIADCEIGPYGLSYASAVGVLIRYAEGTHLHHCRIADGYYSAVSVGWSWGYHFTGSGRNVVEFNDIHMIGKGVLSDMGAIYMLGSQAGTVVRNNVIHGVDARIYGGFGIYNDEGSSGITIENNLVYDTKYAGYNLHYGRDLVVRNNIFAGAVNDQLSFGLKENHCSFGFYNNIVWWKTGRLHVGSWSNTESYRFKWCGNDMRPTAERRHGFLSDYNLYFNPTKGLKDVVFGVDYKTYGNGSWPSHKGEMDFGQWQSKLGNDIHSVWADPLFVDAERKDFRLKPDSPAYRLGFRPVDFSAVGPRRR